VQKLKAYLWVACMNRLFRMRLRVYTISLLVALIAYTTLSSRADSNSEEEETSRLLEIGKLYLDVLPPVGSRSYSVRPSRTGSLLTVSVESRVAPLELKAYGPLNRTHISIAYSTEPYIFYVRDEGLAKLTFRNHLPNVTVAYSFYLDLSVPLEAGISKPILLDGGLVIFHLDLKRADSVSLSVEPSPNLRCKVRVYALYYEVSDKMVQYLLGLHREGSDGSLSFEADAEGRYYIVVESVSGVGVFSVDCEVSSPPWNQGWFWLATAAIPSLLASLWLSFHAGRMSRLARPSRYAVLGDGLSLATLASFSSLIGAYSYRVSTLTLLLQLSTLLYGLTLAVKLYGSILDKRKILAVCPYCNKTVDLTVGNYCCGKQVKLVSDIWYLVPAAITLLLFLAGLTLLEAGFRASNPFYLGVAGGIAGSLVAYILNGKLDRGKSWKLLAIGLAFSALFPIIAATIASGLLSPPIEREWPGRFAWIRIAPPTPPLTVLAAFAAPAALTAYLTITEARELLREASRLPSGPPRAT